jgi:hypothetical protein
MAVDMSVLAFLQASGSPFSRRRSVGRRLQGPSTMLGSDRSRIASDLSSGSGMGKDLKETARTGDRKESSLWWVAPCYPGVIYDTTSSCLVGPGFRLTGRMRLFIANLKISSEQL